MSQIKIAESQGASSADDIRVLLYQNDEIMKNLFKRYLQKHKILFKSVNNFKDLLKAFKVSNIALNLIHVMLIRVRLMIRESF